MNAAGSWIDVPLEESDVAVFIGRAAEQATGGLLKASRYRLVSPSSSFVVAHVIWFNEPCRQGWEVRMHMIRSR
jgi:isopenicillin N synthase-like dioxygenase